MSDLTSQLEKASQPREVRTVADLIERTKPQLVRSLGNEGMADALARHYLTAIRLTPQLMECAPESLLGALLLSAQVRLEPGPLGHVYLVPYKRECVWMLGYTGSMELARRSDRVAALQATVVHERDVYETPWSDEKGVHYAHRPADYADRGDRRAVLVTWREKAGPTWIPRATHVGVERIARAKAASPAARKGTGPWMTDESAMWAKTGIRAVRAWLPLTTEAGYAFAADESRVTGLAVDDAGASQPVLEAGDES